MIKPKGLGRGLDALLGSTDDTDFTRKPAEAETGHPRELAVARLRPGRYQPRTRMDEGALQELAQSIARHGLMQPIVVRPFDDEQGSGRPGRYEIIAGERRYRAAQLAGIDTVPVIVREVADEDALSLALIENIQREELNPLEEAQAIRRLIDEFHYSHELAAEAIGRSRSATSNLLRLLNLAEPVQTMLLAGDIDMGHARALLPLDRAAQIMLANEIHEKGLSVREAEKRVSTRTASGGDGRPARTGASARPDRDAERLQERLAEALGAIVDLRTSAKGAGRLTIRFGNAEQFEGLLRRMNLADALEEL
ncbi:MAG: ParB/RepB/Spo0J family partition protein [Burkholderiaceae bacterium]